MATLVKQKNWYYGQFYDPFKKPTRKRIALKTRTKQVAQKKLRELEDQHSLGAYDPWINSNIESGKSSLSPHSSLKEAIEAFIVIKSERDWRPNTIINASYVLRYFVRKTGESVICSSITVAHFNTFLNRDGIKYETKHSDKKKLKTFLIWLNDRKLAKLNVKDIHINNTGREQTNTINYYSGDDINKLTQYIKKKVERDFKMGYQSKNNSALWLIDFIHWQRLSGMRLSETLNLRVKDINVITWEVVIGNDQFVTKSKKKQILPIQSVEPLKQLAKKKLAECNSDEQRIFGHKCRRHVNRIFKKYLKEALPEKSHLNIHSLRHTCCIELLRARVPIYTVQRWLRHSDVKTTQRYADLLNMDISDQIGEAMNKIEI